MNWIRISKGSLHLSRGTELYACMRHAIFPWCCSLSGLELGVMRSGSTMFFFLLLLFFFFFMVEVRSSSKYIVLDCIALYCCFEGKSLTSELVIQNV